MVWLAGALRRIALTDLLEFKAFTVDKKMHSIEPDVEADPITPLNVLLSASPDDQLDWVAFNPKIAVRTKVLDELDVTGDPRRRRVGDGEIFGADADGQ